MLVESRGAPALICRVSSDHSIACSSIARRYWLQSVRAWATPVTRGQPRSPVSEFAADAHHDLAPGIVLCEGRVRKLEVGSQPRLENIEGVSGELHLMRPAEHF